MGADLGLHLGPDVIMAAQNCLDTNVLGLLPNRSPVNLENLIKIFPQGFQVPLVSSVFSGNLIMDKFGIVLKKII